MDASWPVAGKIDQPLLKSANYLEDRAHEFRVRIKAMMNPKGKKVTGARYRQAGQTLMLFTSHSVFL